MNDKKFERELKKLIYYIREYGIQHISFDRSEIGRIQESDTYKTEFFTQVHKGFYIAQEIVVRLLRKSLVEQKKLKRELASARRSRDKNTAQNTQHQINVAHYQECVLRRIIDSIAWQMLGDDFSSVRRLYMDEEPIDITDSNLDSELRFVEEYQMSQPEGFALISDLSMFVQVGDILTKDMANGTGIIELKEGSVNARVFKLLNSASESGCDYYLSAALTEEGDKFSEQFFRTIKQLNKERQVVEILSTGRGTDPISGKNVTIIQDTVELETYDIALQNLCQHAKKCGHSRTVIQECLTISVFDSRKNIKIAHSEGDGAEHSGKNQTKKKDTATRTIDLRQTMFDPTSCPLFVRNLSPTCLADIVMGRLLVYISLDIPQWMNWFEKDGYTIRRLGKKETAKIRAEAGESYHILEVNGQGFEIQKGDYKTTLGMGLLARIFSTFNTPSSIVDYFDVLALHSSEID